MKSERDKPLDLALTRSPADGGEDKPAAKTHELRRGDLCPQCKKERLDYDGLLNLSCPRCGFTLGGCFT